MMRQRMAGADRRVVQHALMPYVHLLPQGFRAGNERIDEPLPGKSQEVIA